MKLSTIHENKRISLSSLGSAFDQRNDGTFVDIDVTLTKQIPSLEHINMDLDLAGDSTDLVIRCSKEFHSLKGIPKKLYNLKVTGYYPKVERLNLHAQDFQLLSKEQVDLIGIDDMFDSLVYVTLNTGIDNYLTPISRGGIGIMMIRESGHFKCVLTGMNQTSEAQLIRLFKNVENKNSYDIYTKTKVAFSVINKHLDDNTTIYDCSQELIDLELEEYAEL